MSQENEVAKKPRQKRTAAERSEWAAHEAAVLKVFAAAEAEFEAEKEVWLAANEKFNAAKKAKADALRRG